MNIELDERARKQTEAAKALPPEKSWEPAILPPVGVVSRSSADPTSELETGPAPPDHPDAPSVNDPPTPARSTPDA
jgi:hypothetical protein